MSQQLMVQLKNERDLHSLRAHNYKKILENISNNINPDTKKPFESVESISNYINQELAKIK